MISPGILVVLADRLMQRNLIYLKLYGSVCINLLAFSFIYVQFQPGLASGESYPYDINQVSNSRFSCRYNRTTTIGATRGYALVQSMNETLLKDVIGTIGPVTASMNSEYNPFAFYS